MWCLLPIHLVHWLAHIFKILLKELTKRLMLSSLLLKPITLLRSITMFYGIDIILWSILHVQSKYGEYST